MGMGFYLSEYFCNDKKGSYFGNIGSWQVTYYGIGIVQS